MVRDRILADGWELDAEVLDSLVEMSRQVSKDKKGIWGLSKDSRDIEKRLGHVEAETVVLEASGKERDVEVRRWASTCEQLSSQIIATGTGAETADQFEVTAHHLDILENQLKDHAEEVDKKVVALEKITKHLSVLLSTHRRDYEKEPESSPQYGIPFTWAVTPGMGMPMVAPFTSGSSGHRNRRRQESTLYPQTREKLLAS